MKAIRLRTEYLKDPLGIDIQKPLLFWNCEGGSKQAAYRILAQTDGKTVWYSGKVASSSMRAEYPKKLVSRLRVEWKVKLWDESGEGEWSEPAAFEMGLLTPSDRKAVWIAGNYKVNRKKRYPVDCFQNCLRRSAYKRRGCMLRRAGCTKSDSTASAWEIWCSRPAPPFTESASNIRRTT